VADLGETTNRDVDVKSWRERWTSERSLESGNQGVAYEATDADGRRAFVKVLPKKSRSDRRARFGREVRILSGFAIPGIPRLFESNVLHRDDPSYELFLATEFIDGQRLTDVVSGSDMTGREAVELTLKIVRIVAAAHIADVVHRDIKPDNIIIREADRWREPFVVDFGMAYVDEKASDFSTERGEEVGNRFMRLPEFSSGLPNKRERRSDCTFCAGLLYFMLTKRKPSVLKDEQERPPHMWRIERMVLGESGLDVERLLRFFDIGFAYDIDKRYQTAGDLVAALEGLLVEIEGQVEDADAILKRVSERYATPAQRTHAERRASAEGLLAGFAAMLRGINGEIGGLLQVGGYNDYTVPDRYVARYKVSDPVDHLKDYEPVMTVENVASEQTISLDDNFGRSAGTRIAVGDTLSDVQHRAIRAFLLAGIDHATSEKRFHTPVALEPTRHVPGLSQTPGDEICGPCLPLPRPRMEIAWYPPRIVDGRLILAWDMKNVGDATALDVRAFVSNVANYREGEMAAGDIHSNEREFTAVKAYHEFTNGAHVLVEYRDERGDLYRQLADVNASPASDGRRDATYVTTQLGHPYWVLHHAVHPDDGADRFYATEPLHFEIPG